MTVKAILCSDIHLSHKPPACRANEPDWYAAMKRPLDELKYLSEDRYGVPIICAGDVFDRWNSPPQLINFAIRNMWWMFAIPGQHDLPYHNMNEIEKSAFWTLVEHGTIKPAWAGGPVATRDPGLWLHGFPWGRELEPCRREDRPGLHVAVVHRYVWKGQGHPGAKEEDRLDNVKKRLSGYDAIVIGDNHEGYIEGNVMNCGGFMRRSRTDIERRPMVGLLHKDGTIEPHYLDTSTEVIVDTKQDVVDEIDVSEFVSELSNLVGDDSLDFVGAVRRQADHADVDVRQVLLEAIECSETGSGTS